jgi:hypothetical protein
MRLAGEASSAKTEERDLELIRSDPELRPQVLKTPDDPPMIYIKEMAEIEVDAVPEIQRGFLFFPAETNA